MVRIVMTEQAYHMEPIGRVDVAAYPQTMMVHSVMTVQAFQMVLQNMIIVMCVMMIHPMTAYRIVPVSGVAVLFLKIIILIQMVMVMEQELPLHTVVHLFHQDGF